uniref:Uncharacterized protein n=1 Tax=Oryza brachyantha TaxID=4533 RepID=J3L3K2_ORYBR
AAPAPCGRTRGRSCARDVRSARQYSKTWPYAGATCVEMDMLPRPTEQPGRRVEQPLVVATAPKRDVIDVRVVGEDELVGGKVAGAIMYLHPPVPPLSQPGYRSPRHCGDVHGIRRYVLEPRGSNTRPFWA